MPIVIISKRPDVRFSEFDMRHIFDEVVPYVLSTVQNPLQPGNTVIEVNDNLTEKKVDLVVDICCFRDEERYATRDENAEKISTLATQAYINTRTGADVCSAKIKIGVCIRHDMDAWFRPREGDPVSPKLEMTETAMMARIRKRCGFVAKP
ncbi:MAG: hypothetical protein WCI79_01850 [Candidatus Saccharibacteria bacterium]